MWSYYMSDSSLLGSSVGHSKWLQRSRGYRQQIYVDRETVFARVGLLQVKRASSSHVKLIGQWRDKRAAEGFEMLDPPFLSGPTSHRPATDLHHQPNVTTSNEKSSP
jgi:hypothetical protein